MTDRHWLGGRGGNQASNPANWTPTGAPQPGDTLTMNRGTMNITGSPLGADELLVTGDAKVTLRNSVGDHLRIGTPGPTRIDVEVNLTNTSDIHIAHGYDNLEINASGVNHLDLTTLSRATAGSAEIHNSGTLVGSVNSWGTFLRIDGGTFYNVNSSGGRDGNQTTVNANVAGVGVWTVDTYHAPTGKLEFMQSVSADQTVHMGSGLGYGVLQIDQPSTFRANVEWAGEQSVIDLVKLAADSYKYDPAAGVLDFYRGNDIVDVLRINPSPAADSFVGPYTVAQGTSAGSAGVEIYSTNFGWKIPHGADLPLHA